MSKLTADYLFNEASDHESNYDIESVQWNYRQDNKSRNYSDSTVTFDFSDLANSTSYTCYNMWQLILPWTIAMNGIKKDSPENDFAASLKSSILQLIDQVRIEVNDVQMNNPTSYSNIPLNFNLTKMSENELKLLASMINFSPDNAHSIRRASDNVAAVAGTSPEIADTQEFAPKAYEYNNVIQGYKPLSTIAAVATGGAGALLAADVNTAVNVSVTALNKVFDSINTGYGVNDFFKVNTGRMNRMKETSLNAFRDGIYSFYTTEVATRERVSHVASQGVYHGYSIIPLGVLHPFFQSCPPLRGAKLKLNIRLNVNLKYELTFDRATSKYTAKNTISHGNGSNTCPIMVSPIGGGLVPALTNAAGPNNKLYVEFYCGQVDVATGADGDYVTNTIGSVSEGCHIRFPMIQLSPDFENKYLRNPVKKCAFEDFYVYPDNPSLRVDARQSATNIMIHNSISRLRSILILPQSLDIITPTGGGAPTYRPSYESPFSSAPFTTAPFALPEELQIQVNNRNIFNLPMRYTYETFMDNMQKSNIGKISELGIGSGLISKQDFERGMGYCYIDLKNSKYDEEDKLGVPIAITLKNPSKLTVKYIVVLYQEYRYSVDTSKGVFIKEN